MSFLFGFEALETDWREGKGEAQVFLLLYLVLLILWGTRYISSMAPILPDRLILFLFIFFLYLIQLLPGHLNLWGPGPLPPPSVLSFPAAIVSVSVATQTCLDFSVLLSGVTNSPPLSPARVASPSLPGLSPLPAVTGHPLAKVREA